MKSVVHGLIASAIRSPLLWGSLGWAGWYALLLYGPLQMPELQALFAAHPLEYISAGLFFVGSASLVVRSVELARERRILRLLESLGRAGSQSGCAFFCESPTGLRESLKEVPLRIRDSRVVRRFLEIVQHLEQGGRQDELQDFVRYLAEKTAANAAASYALIRMFIWAIPILGFLGTVVGIALALGNLAPQQLEESLPEVMAGLTVAFNTTIQALGLCIVLYFALFFVERAEGRFLERLDSLVDQLVLGWTKQAGQRAEQSTEKTQSALQEMIREALQGPLAVWNDVARGMAASAAEIAARLAEEIHKSITAAFERTFSAHIEKLSLMEHQILAEHRRKLEEFEENFHQRAERLVQLQKSVEEQTEILLRAVEATQVLRTLQETLNRNLASLAASQQFQELLMSLTAAIHLLTARVESSWADRGSREVSSLGVPAIRKAS